MDRKALIHPPLTEAPGSESGKPSGVHPSNEKLQVAASIDRFSDRSSLWSKWRAAVSRIQELAFVIIAKPQFVILTFVGLMFAGCGSGVYNAPSGGGYYNGAPNPNAGGYDNGAPPPDSGGGYYNAGDDSVPGAVDYGYADAPVGDPDYVYGGISFYFVGGRYFYFRNHHRYYAAHLPRGGRYYHNHGGHGGPINGRPPRNPQRPHVQGPAPQHQHIRGPVQQRPHIRGPVQQRHIAPKKFNAPRVVKPAPRKEEKKKR